MIALYREWNERINVVSRKDIDALYEHHILHSLAIAEYVNRFYPGAFDGASILDLGTGGGFPGIPLATEFPSAHFTLCDSIGKKIRVAQAVAEGLQLDNVSCVNARIEALPGPYDFVVSRAVADLSVFYPWVKGKVRSAAFFLKGGELDEEIDACARRCRIERDRFLEVPLSRWFTDPWFDGKKIVVISQ